MFSSSSGNSTLIYNEESQIIIDAGVSFKRIKETASIELNPEAIFITHEHVDHVRGAGVLGRKTLAPIYIPAKSYEHVSHIFNGCDVRFISGGDIIETKGFTIEPFSTRHDAKGSVGFVITDKTNSKKFGMITDTGSVTRLMKLALVGCDAYLIETDYDEQLLTKYEDYDQYLKDRIRGPWGHLGNQQAMDFVEEVIDLDAVEWILF